MLPNLRTVPVGGVFFAIVLFALQLAFGQEQVSRSLVVPVGAPARGPLIERGDHPEWRQFLILAATRRAGEIDRLRELPDTTTHMEEPQAEAQPAELQVAALPDHSGEADPADANGSVAESPSATLPLDIGETSSTELPISKAPEQPPVIRTPQQEKQPQQQSRKASGQQAQLQPAPKPALPIDRLTQLFAPFPANQQDQAVAR